MRATLRTRARGLDLDTANREVLGCLGSRQPPRHGTTGFEP
jgi:hypothetical protein